jgi:hypothetical protein
MRVIDDIPVYPAVHAVYVVRFNAGVGCTGSSGGVAGCGRLLAKVADVTVPERTPSPSRAPSPTPMPTVAPPATPLIPPGGSPVGLFGDGNRPLTAAEFASLWASDPAHLAGRIVIAKGPVPTGFTCQRPLLTLGFGETAPPLGCQIGLLDGDIAQEGYWAIRIGADGKLSIVGEVSNPDTSFVYSFDQAKASGIYAAKPVMVDAWLGWQPSLECDTPPYPSESPCWGGAATSFLTGTQVATAETYSNDAALIRVQLGAYNRFGSTDLTTGPIHGIFLVQYTQGSVEVLARLEVAVP